MAYTDAAATQGNKPAKLKAIASALKQCDQVIIATDCDREDQLIGQEILEHLRYRGSVQRALFTAQDIAAEAEKLIAALRLRPKGGVDLQAAPRTRCTQDARHGESKGRTPNCRQTCLSQAQTGENG
jgi:DNA topoisomerase IA